MKTCSKCKIEKPFEDFGREKRASDGKRSECKACVSEYNRSKKARQSQKRWASSNKAIEDRKVYLARNADSIRATRKAYKNRNADKIRETNARWRDANREEINRKNREYFNSARGKDVSSRHSHRRRSAIASRPSDNWKSSEVFESANWQCFYCGIDVVEPNRAEKGYQTNEAQADHFIPLSNGGTNERRNIVCSCGQCNLSKNSKNPFDFIRDNINQQTED